MPAPAALTLATAGYLDTPLVERLGIDSGSRLFAPDIFGATRFD